MSRKRIFYSSPLTFSPLDVVTAHLNVVSLHLFSTLSRCLYFWSDKCGTNVMGRVHLHLTENISFLHKWYYPITKHCAGRTYWNIIRKVDHYTNTLWSKILPVCTINGSRTLSVITVNCTSSYNFWSMVWQTDRGYLKLSSGQIWKCTKLCTLFTLGIVDHFQYIFLLCCLCTNCSIK